MPLGLAGGFAILTKAGITTVPPSAISGNMGVSPIISTAVSPSGVVFKLNTAWATKITTHRFYYYFYEPIVL